MSRQRHAQNDHYVYTVHKNVISSCEASFTEVERPRSECSSRCTLLTRCCCCCCCRLPASSADADLAAVRMLLAAHSAEDVIECKQLATTTIDSRTLAVGQYPAVFIMAALCKRTGHYIFALWFLSSSSIFLFFSLNLKFSMVADWMSTIFLHNGRRQR